MIYFTLVPHVIFAHLVDTARSTSIACGAFPDLGRRPQNPFLDLTNDPRS